MNTTPRKMLTIMGALLLGALFSESSAKGHSNHKSSAKPHHTQPAPEPHTKAAPKKTHTKSTPPKGKHTKQKVQSQSADSAESALLKDATALGTLGDN